MMAYFRDICGVFITINNHILKWKFPWGLTREIRENKTTVKITMYTVAFTYSQLCLSQIHWDWRNSFNLEKILVTCMWGRNNIQIYQAVRKDSGNYISEEDWHDITILPRGEAPRKNSNMPVPPKICNFHYPFEQKAWYICFISLL